jgi:hypothetical protein
MDYVTFVHYVPVTCCVIAVCRGTDVCYASVTCSGPFVCYVSLMCCVSVICYVSVTWYVSVVCYVSVMCYVPCMWYVPVMCYVSCMCCVLVMCYVSFVYYDHPVIGLTVRFRGWNRNRTDLHTLGTGPEPDRTGWNLTQTCQGRFLKNERTKQKLKRQLCPVWSVEPLNL